MNDVVGMMANNTEYHITQYGSKHHCTALSELYINLQRRRPGV